MSEVNWDKISAALKAPFPGDAVQWRPQGKANSEGKTQISAYIDARDVMDRLDAVVGSENWEFDWTPVVTDAKSVLVAKGTITIFGVAKSDVGDAGSIETNKSAVSDALKRTAVHWGIARYLYELPSAWVELVNGKIPPATLKQLSDRLAKRADMQKAS